MAELYDNRPRTESGDVASRKIFIGGLSYSTDEDKLKRYFRDYGIVQDAVVMKDPVTKRSRGFGFITFFDPLSVDSVLAAEPHVIDGRKVEAKRAVPRSEMNGLGMPGIMTTPSLMGKIGTPMSSPPSEHHKSPPHGSSQMPFDESAYNKVFVGGLHYDTRDHEFREYFSRFGKVVHGEVMFNRETHKSRGFGFVVFESADAALRACDVREHIIDGKVVEVKLAIPRSKIGSTTPGSTGVGMMGGMVNMMSPSAAAAAAAAAAVRGRTLSMGSGMSPSLPLSGNSSTLAAAQGAHKIGPGILSGSTNNLSSLRKPSSMNGISPLTVGGRPVNNAYSASMRLNGGMLGGSSNGIDEYVNEDPLAGAYVEDFVIENVRPSRALSEPIYRYELTGNNASNALFSNDMLSMNSFLQNSSSNTPQYPSPQNTSRSNSIVMQQQQQQQQRGSFSLMGSRSPEPMGLTEKLFNESSNRNSSSNLASLLFPSNDQPDSSISPNTGDLGSSGGFNKSPSQHQALFGQDILFSSPSRENFTLENQSAGSRRTSFAGAGGDIWTNAALSTQTTSDSLWANNNSTVNFPVDNSNSSNNNSNGLFNAIGSQTMYSPRTNSADNVGGGINTVSSLLQQTSISSWSGSDALDSGTGSAGFPPAQRKYSHSNMGSNSSGIAVTSTSSSTNILSELRMNSHEYDMTNVNMIAGGGPGGLGHNSLSSLGNSWGANGRGF